MVGATTTLESAVSVKKSIGGPVTAQWGGNRLFTTAPPHIILIRHSILFFYIIKFVGKKKEKLNYNIFS